MEVGAAEVEFVEEKGQTKQASGQNVHFLMHFRSISAKRFAPYGYKSGLHLESILLATVNYKLWSVLSSL